MSANVKESKLLPVYLIAGEDELKRETVIKRLRARLESAGDLSFNSESFSGESATGQAIVSACNTMPFMSELRLVEVNEVERLKKADSELLISYLQEPCPTTVLALLGSKVPKNSRLYKAVVAFGATAFIDCAPLARKNLPGAVRTMAKAQGITLTEGAASVLIDLVGTNTVALDAEVRKLSLAHRGADPVNESEVLSLVSRTSEAKPWEFVDAFSARNAKRCFYVLERMEHTSSYALLAMCTSRIRELITTKALLERGEAAQLAKVLKMPDWRCKNHRRWAQGFTLDELIGALRQARDTEQAMKSGSDAEHAFELWVLGVCSPKRP